MLNWSILIVINLITLFGIALQPFYIIVHSPNLELGGLMLWLISPFVCFVAFLIAWFFFWLSAKLFRLPKISWFKVIVFSLIINLLGTAAIVPGVGILSRLFHFLN